MAAAFATPAQAIEWRFQPSITGTATYTDNANQSEDDPQDAMIFTAAPTFSLTSYGSRRVEATVNYGLRGTARFGEREDTNLNHNLNATGKAELVEDFLFIDGRARVSQELISLFGSPAEADVNDSNRATVSTYLVSPYVQKRLGTFANALARYTKTGAIFENDVAARANVNAFTAALTSGTRFTDLNWGLNYSIRDVQNRGETDATFESVSATAGYALTRKFRVFGTVGQDWNDYLSTTETDGSFYSVGFGWSPTRRTSVEAAAGERYFGRTLNFSGSHRTRLSRWTVRYYEDVSDITQQLLNQSGDLFFVCSTAPHFVPADDAEQAPPENCEGPISAGLAAAILMQVYGLTPEELLELGFPTSIVKGVYIIKNLNAGVSWDIGRLTLGLSAQDTKRIYQEFLDAQDQIRTISGTASYRMSPRTTAHSSLSLSRRSADGILTGGTVPRDDDIWRLSLGLRHEFSRDLSGGLTFRHIRRDSNAADANYDENRLTATVTMRF
jgi:uncharacterized protein (PEP-CTERM system associated)